MLGEVLHESGGLKRTAAAFRSSKKGPEWRSGPIRTLVQSVSCGICSKVSLSVHVETCEAGFFDVPSTSTTVSGVFAVRLNKNFDVCKSLRVQAFARHSQV